MGDYTKFVFAADLIENIPDEVFDALEILTFQAEEPEGYKWPNHPFFTSTGFHQICMNVNGGNRGHQSPFFRHNTISKEYQFGVRSNLKNYYDEIELFLDWLHPYMDRYNYILGYTEYDHNIKLIFYSDEKIVYEYLGSREY